MQEIDDAANMWEKTKDPKYKDEWYKLIRRYVDGLNIIERRVVSSSRSDERNDKGNYIVK
tara:strand:+ start:1118 stop:1297 length:180 start_codon:yes stop_codon:yes gene_type:complete